MRRITIYIFLSFCTTLFAAVVPESSVRYYLLQTATRSGKVVSATSFSEAVVHEVNLSSAQLFEFIPVAGKSDTYFLRNADGLYLTNSPDLPQFTEYDTAPVPGYGEWLLEGNSLISVRLKALNSNYLGTENYNHGTYLYCDRTATDASAGFSLVAADAMIQNGLIDGGFENAVVDGAPLGTWVADKELVLFGEYGYSRVQGLNGWASAGDKAFYLRFLGDASSYNAISQKLYNLVPGATYRLDLQYKCQSTSATSLVNVYAATTPNAARTASVGGVYSVTKVAASNLATQNPQNLSLTFVAPSKTLWIVYAKNTQATNFNFFIDQLSLTETIPSALQETTNQFKISAVNQEGSLTVRFNSLSSAPVSLVLADISGKMLDQRNFIPVPGENICELKAGLSPGFYLVRLTQDNEMSIIKLILK